MLLCRRCGNSEATLLERLCLKDNRTYVFCEGCWSQLNPDFRQFYTWPKLVRGTASLDWPALDAPKPIEEATKRRMEEARIVGWCPSCRPLPPRFYKIQHCIAHKPRPELYERVEASERMKAEYLGVHSLPVPLTKETRTAFSSGRSLSIFEPRTDVVSKIRKRETKTLGRISILEAWDDKDEET